MRMIIKIVYICMKFRIFLIKLCHKYNRAIDYKKADFEEPFEFIDRGAFGAVYKTKHKLDNDDSHL